MLHMGEYRSYTDEYVDYVEVCVGQVVGVWEYISYVWLNVGYDVEMQENMEVLWGFLEE